MAAPPSTRGVAEEGLAMSALQKLKAYFGMVPAEDVDAYDDRDKYGHQGSSVATASYAEGDDYDTYPDRVGGRRSFGASRDRYRNGETDDYEPEPRRTSARRDWGSQPPVRGSLAIEPSHEPVTRIRPAADPAPFQLGRIITLHPKNFGEARTIGEHYREGTPVIINLTEMDDSDARRLVDFAAGLAFALRGAIDKVTNKVFLLSPPNIDVTAEQRQRLAEGGFFSQG